MKKESEESKNEMRSIVSRSRSIKINYPIRVIKKNRKIYATRIEDNTGRIDYLVSAK